MVLGFLKLRKGHFAESLKLVNIMILNFDDRLVAQWAVASKMMRVSNTGKSQPRVFGHCVRTFALPVQVGDSIRVGPQHNISSTDPSSVGEHDSFDPGEQTLNGSPGSFGSWGHVSRDPEVRSGMWCGTRGDDGRSKRC